MTICEVANIELSKRRKIEQDGPRRNKQDRVPGSHLHHIKFSVLAPHLILQAGRQAGRHAGMTCEKVHHFNSRRLPVA